MPTMLHSRPYYTERKVKAVCKGEKEQGNKQQVLSKHLLCGMHCSNYFMQMKAFTSSN